MGNLIIIGNGFDLAHGMKTSYYDFIKDLIEDNEKNKDWLIPPGFDTKTGVENKYEYDSLRLDAGALASIKYIDSKNKRSQSNEQNQFKKPLLYFLMKETEQNRWCDIERVYFKILNKIDNKDLTPLCEYTRPEYLNKDFELLKNALEKYLTEQEGKAQPIECYKELFQKLDSEKTLILNFNYTSTVKSLYQDVTKNSKIIHIHGELNNQNNPIVFGYAADQEESRILINKHDNQYLRNIKKHLYKRTTKEVELTEFLDKKEKPNIDVFILGHSIGLSDKLILNQIFNYIRQPGLQDTKEHDIIQSIRIFYYKDYDGYFDTQVNIDRIMNNDERFRRLVINYQNSLYMPQHNDDEEIQHDFIQKIRDFNLNKEKPINKNYNNI